MRSPGSEGHDDPGGGDRRARAEQRRRAAPEDRGARRLPRLVRVAHLAARAAVSAPTEGRALYAGLLAPDVPEEPVARLWHAATLLREHRGDGHNSALVANGIGGTGAHVLLALSFGMTAEEFDRTHHLPKGQLAAVVDGLRSRGLVDAAGSLIGGTGVRRTQRPRRRPRRRTLDRRPHLGPHTRTESPIQMADQLGTVFAQLDCTPRWR